MDFVDERTTVIWEAGDLIVTASTVRYWLVQHDSVDDPLVGKFSLVNIVTSKTAMTRPTIADLKASFQSLFSVQEVIKSGDLMVTAVNR